ncbi:MAG TPA: bifunctional glutamate N-acetyltransferase/amino-acid acetyltransferase ArgJ [Egibacteraceae bacterium]|nr:bifunctional glutamate N-acetyltransferase/amino-acid acetyltransferase ArgJ [Egibacteraceae bacterium]
MSVASRAAPALEDLEGGVCATPGVQAAGISAGLKASGKLDLALVATHASVPAAAVLTRNQVTAAPVEVTRRNIADGRARAVLLNSGNANVCTGPDGVELAEQSAIAVAGELGCKPSDILLCSTGVIGVPNPAQRLLDGIPKVVAQLSGQGGALAARAIMTTDNVPKEAAVRVSDEQGSCVIGGMAKGSGMIAPEMATMLCVVTTDAPVGPPVLKGLLRQAVARSFNRISVDDCMSTNDTVIAMATGTTDAAPSLGALRLGMEYVCQRLAEALIRDGEGATKLVRVRVTGALSEDEAVEVGRSIARSALFRTAIAGGDPNWGRVLAAMGAGRVTFDPARVSVSFGKVTVCRFGVAAAFDRGQAAATLAGSEVDVTVHLGMGEAEATFQTCDLTHAYITINAEYTT